ncbi:protein translocase subunit SecF [Candidatus Peregrinibacteria bacterium]|nr:protein translocase subunit SecF [Candidatus Peregrinibacteria bacterium]
MKNRTFLYTGLIILGGLFLAFFDLPSDKQLEIAPFTPEIILNSEVNLGLDLQGGSQLDYKVDLRKVPEADQKMVITGILDVMNRRVNSLGVAEPNIYTSDIGDEKHIIVELAGVKDLEEAKAVVGKTIQLEFKEEAEETPDNAELEAEVKGQAQQLLDKVLAGGDLRVLGQEETQANPSTVFYAEETEWKYKDEIRGTFAEKLFELEPGQTADALLDNSGELTVDAEGQIVNSPAGFYIVQTTEKRDEQRTIDTPRQVNVSHILIAHKDAQQPGDNITRTEEEAKARAEEVIQKLQEGTSFEDLAKEYSDDESNAQTGGVLDAPVVKDSGTYVKEFEDAATAFEKAGDITTEPVKSPFGYHIIKANDITEATSTTESEPQVKYIAVYFSAAPDPWQETELDGSHFVRADVEFAQNTLQPYVSIIFDDEGARIFEELTRKNLNKQIAIFVGGVAVSAPNVNQVISGGRAQITGQFSVDEAEQLARDLNTGAIPAPVTPAGQYSIGATLGQDALQSSLYAGAIGLMILAAFMILLYRLPGIIAVTALAVYTAFLIFLIKIAMPISWALAISVAIFVYLVMNILKSRESGPEKSIAAVLACFLLFFIAFILSTPVVMTLAGIAGIILSIGMAVDANILIFERIKEELRDGRQLSAAIEVGFDRAWDSIRDSNFSSLITCGILFYFGTSIIQGFAFNLAAGILVSMFTAITISKTLLQFVANTRFGQSLWLFGGANKKEKKLLQIVSNRKKVYWFSGIMLAAVLIGWPVFGMRLGLDFTGGSLIEISTENKDLSIDQVKEGLITTSQNLSAADLTEENSEESEDVAETSSPAVPSIQNTEEKVDFEKSLVVKSGDGFIIKTPHMSSAYHDALIAKLTEHIGPFEENRFATVGPTVGQSLQQKAIVAILAAVVMIILYVAFAFRKVPRSIGKWRFGLCAIAALVHDLGIMIGVYIYLGMTMGVEVDALFITAMLTVLGFSVHDTIVVFDRIRENLKHQKRDETFAEVANRALNETMARSLNTSISTLIVLLALALLGAPTIKFFVIALLVGIVSGTYSSIFVATPLLVDWQERYHKKRS